MVISPSLEGFINYNSNVGTEALHITGFPGSGKSNQGTLIFLHCMRRGDMGLLRGDRFAEWRHCINYLKDNKLKMRVLVPPNWEDFIKSVNIPINILQRYDCTIKEVQYPILNIMDDMAPRQITVIYDACLDLKDKGWLWVGIFEQLLNRIEDIDVPITHLDHEAGILWPEIALSESKRAQTHWKAVNKMCELFVDFRKALIRPILISQLESEIKHQIREKCMFRIHRQGVVSHRNPEQVIKEAPRQRIDQYICTIGREIYRRYNIVEKLIETKKLWKMVPTKIMHYTKDEESNGHIIHAVCLDCGADWTPRDIHTKRCQYCMKNPGNVKILELSPPPYQERSLN